MVGKGRVLLLVFLLVSLQASSDSYYIRVRLSIYKVGKSPKKVSFSFKEKNLKNLASQASHQPPKAALVRIMSIKMRHFWVIFKQVVLSGYLKINSFLLSASILPSF